MPYPVSDINEIHEQRAKLELDIQSLYTKAKDEKRQLSVDETATVDKMLDESDTLLKEARRRERIAGIASADTPVTRAAVTSPETGTAPVVDEAENRAVGAGPRDTPEYRAMFSKFLGATDFFEAGQLAQRMKGFRLEKRDLQTDNDTQAGILVPPEQFVAELIKNFDSMVKIRQFARVFQIRQARSLGAVKRTARLSSAAWGAEIGSPTADSALAYGKRALFPSYLSVLAKISRDLLRSSVMPVDQMVREEIAYDAGALMETGFFTGNGVGQPLGVFTASAEGISTSRDITSASSTEAQFADLVDAVFSIKEQYTNLRWMGRRAAKKVLYSMRDGEGRPIFVPSYVAGEVDRVMGFPFTESEFAPAPTTGNYALILGDFSNYWIADALDLEFQILVESYALTNQNGYLARAKVDGMPVKEEAFARIKLA